MKYYLPLGLVIATLATSSFAQSVFTGFYGQVSTGVTLHAKLIQLVP